MSGQVLPDAPGGQPREHVAYFDYLRVLGAFMVVMIHVCAKKWYSVKIDTYGWQVLNLFDSVTRWSVPVFFMISGALFLGGRPSTRRIYTRYVPRMVAIYFVWSMFYSLLEGGTPTSIVYRTIEGHYQMWFLPVLVGGYLCVPFLRQIAKSREAVICLFGLTVVITSILPIAVTFLNEYYGENNKTQLIALLLGKPFDMKLGFPSSEIVYFVLGRYLAETDFTKKQRRAIYITGAAGFVLTAVLTVVFSFLLGEQRTYFYENLSFTTVMESVGVFVWFKYNANGRKLDRLMAALSPLTLGVYLLHPFFLDEVLMKLGMGPLAFEPLLAVPAMTLAGFALSVAAAWLFRKIPLIGKYLM